MDLGVISDVLNQWNLKTGLIWALSDLEAKPAGSMRVKRGKPSCQGLEDLDPSHAPQSALPVSLKIPRGATYLSPAPGGKGPSHSGSQSSTHHKVYEFHSVVMNSLFICYQCLKLLSSILAERTWIFHDSSVWWKNSDSWGKYRLGHIVYYRGLCRFLVL